MFRAEFPEPTPDKASQAVRGFYEEAQNSFTMIGKSAMIVQNFEQPHGYYISVLGAPLPCTRILRVSLLPGST